MRFLWTTIHVKDMEKSLGFYRDVVGLDLKRRFGGAPGPEMAFLGGDGGEVELISDGSGKEAKIGIGISIGFEVDSLTDKMAFIREKGFDITGGPIQPSPSVRFFFVKDPDGLSVQFVENIR